MNRFFPRYLIFGLLLVAACRKGTPTQEGPLTTPVIRPIDRPAWYNDYPGDVSGEKVTVSGEEIRLGFFGWNESDDKRFTLNFPEDGNYRRAILKYRMGAWNQGCSPYDNTTFVMAKYKDEWYELVRLFTPFGNWFGPDWERSFYFDVTDCLPMLRGATEFRIYYGGFDATAERAHTATLSFDLYKGTPDRTMVYAAKMYDSSRDGNSGYRAFSYGVEGADIEAPGRMDERTFTIPAGVKTLEMRVAISGHGHDSGTFPDRPDYATLNAAEFDRNTYTFKVNGAASPNKGTIFSSCGDNYPQAGSYFYDRGNWCPGNPLRTQYWRIVNFPTGSPMRLDIDLERFVSSFGSVRDEGVAQYIVQVDLYGFDK